MDGHDHATLRAVTGPMLELMEDMPQSKELDVAMCKVKEAAMWTEADLVEKRHVEARAALSEPKQKSRFG